MILEVHPDPETLRRFTRGELPPDETRHVVQHLLTGCSECRQNSAMFWPSAEARRRPSAEHGGDRGELDLREVLAKLGPSLTAMADEKACAPMLLRELAHHPPRRQLLLIRNSRRYHSLALCELAAERALEEGPRASSLALRLARLAVAVAAELPRSGPRTRLRSDFAARAWAALADARLRRGEHSAAERAFAQGRRHLAEGTGDPLESARLHGLLAALRHAQRRFGESDRLIDGAIAAYRQSGEEHQLGRALIEKGVMLGERGDRERAALLLRKGLSLLDPELAPAVARTVRRRLGTIAIPPGRSRSRRTGRARSSSPLPGSASPSS